jgi:perosamine synthetase
MIPVSVVKMGDDEEALVLEVLRSGQLAQGTFVDQLEQAFAAAHDVRHAIAVNNGTTALIAAMRVLDIGPGSEVVTSPFTFVATLNAILDTGATARFADIGSDFNVVPELVDAAVTDRTAAIMPVHLYGQPADMKMLMETAARHDLDVIEDAAQAVGATFDGRPVGGFGIGCFSLYATKNISTGEGGVITTNDDAVADRLRLMRNQGMRERYQYEMAGNNYRLTNLCAAVGIPQLQRLESINESRRANAKALSAGLEGLPGLVPPPECPADRTHVYHQFTVRITDEAPLDRDQFIAALAERGIGSGIYYPKVVFDYDCYRDHPGVVTDHVPEAFRAAREVVSLPVHPHLTQTDLDQIVDTIREVMTA